MNRLSVDLSLSRHLDDRQGHQKKKKTIDAASVWRWGNPPWTLPSDSTEIDRERKKEEERRERRRKAIACCAEMEGRERENRRRREGSGKGGKIT